MTILRPVVIFYEHDGQHDFTLIVTRGGELVGNKLNNNAEYP
jgi:hypothetical protein